MKYAKHLEYYCITVSTQFMVVTLMYKDNRDSMNSQGMTHSLEIHLIFLRPLYCVLKKIFPKVVHLSAKRSEPWNYRR